MDRRDFLQLSASGAVALLTPMVACGPSQRLSKAPAEVLVGNNYLFFDRDGRSFSVLPDENAIAQVGAAGSLSGTFNNPVGVAFNRAGDLFVLDRGNNRIQHFDQAGTLVEQLSAAGTEPGYLAMPSALAIDSYDRLIVADTLNHRVQVFENNSVMRVLGEAEKMNAPRSLLVWPDDSLWVLDSNSRILAYDSRGNFTQEIALASPRKNGVVIARGMAVDKNNLVYVADLAFSGLHVLDARGNFLEHRAIEQDGIPVTPLHIAADDAGNLHVAAVPSRAA